MDETDRVILEGLKKKFGEGQVHWCGYCQRIVVSSLRYFKYHIDDCEKCLADDYLRADELLDSAEDEFFKEEDDDRGWRG